MKRGLMIAVFAVGLFGSVDASAMTMQLGDRPDGRATILYRFQRPYFAQDIDTELFTGYHEIQAWAPGSGRFCAVFSLPLARVTDGRLRQRTILGNAYLGIHIDKPSPHGLAVSAGAFLPTAGESYGAESLVALLSDPHHYHRFYPDLLTLHLDVAQEFVAQNGLYVHGELGPDLWLPVGDTAGRDVELIARYGIGVGRAGARWDCGVEFVGWSIVTSEGPVFGEASSCMLSVGVEYKGDGVTPGVFASMPTADAFAAVDWLLGARLKVALD